MIEKLFIDIQNNKENYLSASKGTEFEERIGYGIDRLGYTRILQKDIDPGAYKDLKSEIIRVASDRSVANPFPSLQRHYIRQPYGSQNYPDFLVMHGSRIASIEVKFSGQNQAKPVWNSGLPRPNGIYIFGAFKRRDVTFFRGCDILSHEDAEKLHAFFGNVLTEQQKSYNKEHFSRQSYGFSIYVRKAFDQNAQSNKNAILDYFSNPHREELERSVIRYLAE